MANGGLIAQNGTHNLALVIYRTQFPCVYLD